MYYYVIVAFCQHVLNEHAMLCYTTRMSCHQLSLLAIFRFPLQTLHNYTANLGTPVRWCKRRHARWERSTDIRSLMCNHYSQD